MDRSLLEASDTFARRHIGPSDDDIRQMLDTIGCASLDELTNQTVPASIRAKKGLMSALPAALSESQAIAELRAIAGQNRVMRSCIGMGYYDCITPPVILRNILENPGWYTQYTPYQAEIAQGRLEALLNFQTMVADLTGLPLANASLLDEATAAAEAMAMCHRITSAPGSGKRNKFFIANDCHPQTISVCQTRAWSMGIDVVVGSIDELNLDSGAFNGVLLQYPNTYGAIVDYGDIVERAHAAGALVVVATDLLALTLLTPPGEFRGGGADIAIGSAQRFGVPMGFGGPHAAFMATREEHARKMPGRIVGVSKDADGNPAFRLAIQTREQHIKRDRATSNICTAQVLLAIMASMYAVYHGPDGLRRIARRVHAITRLFAEALAEQGHEILNHDAFFDTLHIRPVGYSAKDTLDTAVTCGFNLRDFGDGTIGISFDETTSLDTARELATDVLGPIASAAALVTGEGAAPETIENRTSSFLTHPVFNTYHAEHELLRYINRLQSKDLSLTTSMIALGSCTMKLNATSEMIPITWESFARMHPYAPADQATGYAKLFRDLESWLAAVTGLPAVSLQPNAGSQGEYAGLLAIRAYHDANQVQGSPRRDVCLIPVSAHGTNPASAVIAGFRVVPVNCDPQGNVEVEDLRKKAAEHANRLAALMITYPSTHGVFEQDILDITKVVHDHGGQVYMDGANMNALVGVSSPAAIGADVCHINLHKTFCIPHGGGGPGMGPICAAEHLRPFLPADPVAMCDVGCAMSDVSEGNDDKAHRTSNIAHRTSFPGPVSAAAYGSAAILPISWMYIRMMGADGLRKATQVAILNANYMAARLERDGQFAVLFKGKTGRVAHEFVLDCRHFRVSAAVEVEDIAKRLMDYGFHAPTMSWPVPGTLMVEPTESESRAELDRFCDALLSIRAEIAAIERAEAALDDNVLKNAPHTAARVCADQWPHRYSRELAAYPTAAQRHFKFWPSVARIDNAYGDRHLACTCDAVEAYAEK